VRWQRRVCAKLKRVLVHAHVLPQMADVADVADVAGVVSHALTLPVLASESHSLANVRKRRAQMLTELREVVALRNDVAPGVSVEVGLSTAFGCTLQGTVDENEVIAPAVACVQAGVDEVGLSDTTGMANPAQVRRLFTRLRGPHAQHARAGPGQLPGRF